MPEDSAAPAVENSPPAPHSRFQVMFRALQHRNFQLFFGGQLISLIGTWMDTVAEAWLVYRLTGSSLLLGTVAFAGQIPVFLLAPLGGMAADRWNRRSIVIATQSSSMVLAGILAGLTLSGRVKVWEVIMLAAFMGVVNAFDIPARQAFLVEMVGREDLMNAIALNSSMFNGARVIGPAVAGILVASIGEGWCFFANSVSYIAVITGLLLMKIAPREIEHRGESAIEHIAEGFRFVRHTKPILALLLLLGLVSLVAMPYSVLMPVFAARILHGNARTLGILMGATGVGALTGALILASKQGLKGLGSWVAFSCGGFGATLILFSFSHWYFVSIAFLVPVGLFMMVQMASSNTLIQAMVPDRLRGRTMAVYSMMFMGMAPLGSLLAGVLAQHIGAQWTVGIGGLCAIGGAFVFGSILPQLRIEARQLILAQGIAGGEPAGNMTTRALERS
ncbi:MAG TPA: MFS transporter [Candidatus Acidoferrales bacterium]|nr:MFS transporter [Candidatus Acidoferrales bacterium]